MAKAPGATKKVSKGFQTALARPVLNRLATIPVFQQGQELLLHHHVTGLVLESDEAAANVDDGQKFLTRLWMEDGFLQYECACERGTQGLLCAHGVAVALAALEGKPAAGKAKAKPKTIDLAQTDKILREQSSDTLAGLLLNWARQDDRFLQHLMSFAALQGGLSIDLKSYRASLKKRLKRPNMSANAAEYRRFTKAVATEIQAIQALADQGQAYVALELAADIVNLLLTLGDHGSAGDYLPLALIPAALELFVVAARKARATPEVLIPHVLRFYQQDPHEGPEVLNLKELLGEGARLELAKAAEAKIEPKRQKWEERVTSLRMLKLAQGLYLEWKDFDAVERVGLKYGASDRYELLSQAGMFLKHGEPKRTLAFLEKVRAIEGKQTLARDWNYLAAEAHLKLGEPEAALEAMMPILHTHHPTDLQSVIGYGEQHNCWPAWRKLLLADRPAEAKHQHYWQFLIHMKEKNYPAAWAIALLHSVPVPQACECAMEMRAADPENAARLLAAAAAELLSDTTAGARAIGYLDVAAALVIDQGVRPAGVAAALRGAQRRYSVYGAAHLVRSREPVWNKAIAFLEAMPTSPLLTLVRRR